MNKKSSTSKSKRIEGAVNGHLTLCLYVAGNAPNSQMAVSNLTAICEQYLVGRCQLEIVDVLTSPQRALADGILVTPSLACSGPQPAVRIVGNLNDHNSVLHALGIT